MGQPHAMIFVVLSFLGVAFVGETYAWGSNLGRAALLERFSWRILDFAYPDELSRELAISRRQFIPENALPVGIEVWGNKLFVSVPRWKDGIPATLNYISLDANVGGSPKLTPYPNWAQNEAGACGRGLTTVYRIHADECNRLWVLDTGTIGIGNTTVQACPYKLNVFDLTTDKLVREYKLRDEDINGDTFIANIAVDLGKGGCDDAFAYMSDELGYGLIVYSWSEHKSWRVEHSYFMPDPLAGDYNIGGLNFQWGDEGIFGMSLSPLAGDGYRTLFFHPLSSNREFAVSTRILRDEKIADNSYHEFDVLEERGPLAHCTASVMDHTGLQFFNLIDRNAVGCWNSRLPYTAANHAIIAKHDEAISFPADVKVKIIVGVGQGWKPLVHFGSNAKLFDRQARLQRCKFPHLHGLGRGGDRRNYMREPNFKTLKKPAMVEALNTDLNLKRQLQEHGYADYAKGQTAVNIRVRQSPR